MFYSKRKQSKLMKKCKNSLIKWCCRFSHTGNDRILNAITQKFMLPNILFTAMGSAQGDEYDSVVGPYIGIISSKSFIYSLKYY